MLPFSLYNANTQSFSQASLAKKLSVCLQPKWVVDLNLVLVTIKLQKYGACFEEGVPSGNIGV